MVDIKTKLDKGWIHSRIVLELIGKPKDHVEATAKAYLDRIKQDKNIDLIEQRVDPAEPAEGMDGFFVIIAEIEVLMPSLNMLAGFCFDYMPASIEIIEPRNMTFNARDISALMNELQNKLHTLDMAIKQTRMESDFLRKNTHQLLQNITTLMLMQNNHTAEEMAGAVGLDPDQMKGFLDKLVKLNKIELNGDTYSLPKKDDQRKKQD